MIKISNLLGRAKMLLLWSGLGWVVACDRGGDSIQPLPQDPLIQVYFNQSSAARYREPYRQQERAGDNLEQVLIDAILAAQVSIDVAVQEIQLPEVTQALVNRHQAGVKVRVIVENNYRRPLSDYSVAEVAQLPLRDQQRHHMFHQWLDQDGDGSLSRAEINQGDAMVQLQGAGIPLIDDQADGSKGSGLMHHKFMVIDQALVITGSANWTPSGVHGDWAELASRGNANHLLRIESAPLAQLFRQEFQLMWGDGPGQELDSRFGLQKLARSAQTLAIGDSTITVQFSPLSPTKPWEQSSNGFNCHPFGSGPTTGGFGPICFFGAGVSRSFARASKPRGANSSLN
jgi:phosphatidylserine/phosphatidylglycerophosphate/cardiolipin synthase-like enzyme